MQNKGQLQLFTEKKTPEIDELVYYFNCSVGDYKYLAYLIEGSIGRNHAFNWVLEGARVSEKLVDSLKPLSIKYQNKLNTGWKIKSEYDPYYSPLEPRSTFTLSDIALDYKVRFNSLIMRNKAILDQTNAKIVKLYHELMENNERIEREFKKLILCKA